MVRIKTVKETNFEIEPDPVQPPPELPGSEKIGFIDATTARFMVVGLLQH